MDLATLNEDWIKTLSWDLPTDFDGLVWAIGASNFDHDGQVEALRHFMTLPAWTIAPLDLEKQVIAFAGEPIANVSDVRSQLLRYSEDQPRDADGRFGSGDGVVSEKDAAEGNFHGQGETADSPIKTSNINVAAAALGAGKFIQLDQKQSVGTLLDKLATIANEAKAAGKDAPNYNLCQCQVADSNIFCAGNKGIGRDLMPQLKGVPVPGSPADSLPKDKNGDVDLTAGFIAHLADLGITSHPDTVAVDLLHSTQNELVGTKVAGIMKAGEAGKLTEQAPYIVSMDNYLLDGHHRWAAQVGQQYDSAVPNQTISADVTRVHSDIGTIVGLAHAYALAQGVPPKDATASARAAARRAWGASVRATTAAITNASDIRSALLRYSEDQARDPDGKFAGGSGDRITPLQSTNLGPHGESAVTATGKYAVSINAENTMAGLPPDVAKEVTATLEDVAHVTQGEAQQNMVDMTNHAIAESADPNGSRTPDGRTAVEAGLAWYDEAHDFCGAQAEIAGPDITSTMMCGVAAALSPGNDWDKNMAGVQAMAVAYSNKDFQISQAFADKLNSLGNKDLDPSFKFKQGDTLGSLLANPPAGAMAVAAMAHMGVGYGYGNIQKAIQIMNGADIDRTLTGPKVREFFNSINAPKNTISTTIDIHMMRISVNGYPPTQAGYDRMKNLGGTAATKKNVSAMTGSPSSGGVSLGAYPALADAGRDASAQINQEHGTTWTPLQMQAIAWVQQKIDFPDGPKPPKLAS